MKPLWREKGWTRGPSYRGGVGKAPLCGFLDGMRRWISRENRLAIAEARGIEPEALPE